MSKGLGGKVSDELITEKCGLSDFLQPGNVILANHGFNVQEAVEQAIYYCTKVKV